MTLLTVIQFLVAGILGFVVGGITEPTPNFTTLSTDTLINLGYLGVFASCISLLFQNTAVAHVDPAPASLFLATESVFGVSFSILFLGEVLTIPLFFGFALIFAGIVISECLPLRAEKRAEQRTCDAATTADASAAEAASPSTHATSGVLPEQLAPVDVEAVLGELES